MEFRENPEDRKTAAPATTEPATAEPATADYRLSLADLEPARGLTDDLDDVIFGLCDSSFLDTFTSNIPDTDEPGHLARFCHHLRLTTNADTVYLCDRQSLQIETTTSIDFAEDTADLHRALTSAISNLDECREAFALPDVRVFPDHAKLSFTVIPLRPQTPSQAASGESTHAAIHRLAVIVDADDEYRTINTCLTTAVQAVFDAFATDSSAPDNKQLQRAVFDRLKHQHHLCSAKITGRRQEIFQLDLQHVTVHFEKLLALDSISASSAERDNTAATTPAEEPWGWQAVASLLEDDHFPQALYQQANLWGESFTTELDTHLLMVAALRYKEVCEAANLNSFDSIKPLCLKIHAESLRQQRYTDTLQQLTEMGVIRGNQLLLELSEQSSVSAGVNASAENELVLRDFNEQLQACRHRFGVQIGLSEFGTGHSSLLRLNTLKPDVIRPAATLLPDRNLPVDEWVDSAQRLPYLSEVKTAASTTSNRTTAQILVDGSQMPETGESLHDLFETPEVTIINHDNRKSLAA